jgi:hypothetical protein
MTTIRDSIVKDAQSLPDLIERAESVDPALAKSLSEKSLVGSKSVWAPAATWVVTWGASHFGLGWDQNTCALVASLLAWVAVIGARYVTRSPIGGVFKVTNAKT